MKKIFSLLIFCFFIQGAFISVSVSQTVNHDGYFTDLKSTIGIEDKVKILDLVNVDIKNDFSEYKNLEELYIVSSKIDSISGTIIELKRLKFIKIENSQLKFVHSDIFKLSSLKYLTIKGNLIENIDFKENSLIEYLDISFNKLSSLDGLQKLKNLRKIICSGNRITYIPCEVLKLENLQSLDL